MPEPGTPAPVVTPKPVVVVPPKTYRVQLTRYKIRSPRYGRAGTISESIREISSTEAANLRSRGYTLLSVPSTVGLHEAVISRPTRGSVLMFQKRKMGIIPRTYTLKFGTGRSITHRVLTKVSSSRRLFQEPYYRPSTKQIIDVSRATAEKLRQRGIELISAPGRSATGRGGATPPTSYSPGSYNPRTTHTITPTTTISPSVPEIQTSNALTGAIHTLTQELQNQKDWITSINKRLSDQMIDMGSSTTDRSNEIQKLKLWVEENNARVSKQLVDLGNATTDASKAIAIKQAEQTVKQVDDSIKKGAGGVLGNITGIFSNPSTIILITIIVVVVIIIKLKR